MRFKQIISHPRRHSPHKEERGRVIQDPTESGLVVTQRVPLEELESGILGLLPGQFLYAGQHLPSSLHVLCLRRFGASWSSWDVSSSLRSGPRSKNWLPGLSDVCHPGHFLPRISDFCIALPITVAPSSFCLGWQGCPVARVSSTHLRSHLGLFGEVALGSPNPCKAVLDCHETQEFVLGL